MAAVTAAAPERALRHPGIVERLARQCFLLLALIAFTSAASAVVHGEASERSVKAAYIYRFLPYVQWPAEAFEHAGSPIVIGMVGGDDVASVLEALVPGRLAQNRPLLIRRIAPGASTAGVHVLFIGREASARTAALTKALRGSVLTITDMEGGLDKGAMINFVTTDGRVRFEVAVDNADRSALRLSSRLLTVALRVRSGD